MSSVAHVKALARQAPPRGEELNSLLGPLVKYHSPIEALPKDIQHRMIFREHFSHEMRDPTLLSYDCQALDQDRPEAAIVEVVGDLNGDFRSGPEPTSLSAPVPG
jgi:hypothetical protein